MKSPKRSNKVYDKFWYVVDLDADLFTHGQKKRPALRSNHFATEQDARNAIQRGLHNNTLRYDVISGEFANKHGFRIFSYSRTIKQKRHILDYSYPAERNTRQKRKTYRTIMRRRARGETNPDTPIKMIPLIEDVCDKIGRLYKRGNTVKQISIKTGLSLKITKKGLLLYKITQL